MRQLETLFRGEILKSQTQSDTARKHSKQAAAQRLGLRKRVLICLAEEYRVFILRSVVRKQE